MADKGKSGFVLILIIAVIAVVGLEMFVLTGGSNIMLFQADIAHLRAVRSGQVEHR